MSAPDTRPVQIRLYISRTTTGFLKFSFSSDNGSTKMNFNTSNVSSMKPVHQERLGQLLTQCVVQVAKLLLLSRYEHAVPSWLDSLNAIDRATSSLSGASPSEPPPTTVS